MDITINQMERFILKCRSRQDCDCVEWVGSSNNRGYGQVRIKGMLKLSHRISYEMVRGPIPEGLYVDHLCRNRKCVNPLHMELVTFRENILRGESVVAKNALKKTCKYGHTFREEQSKYFKDRRSRRCHECHANVERNRGRANARRIQLEKGV